MFMPSSHCVAQAPFYTPCTQETAQARTAAHPVLNDAVCTFTLAMRAWRQIT
jgi:hypothetical protein